MKLVWSPEAATEAYHDTVKTCHLSNESGVAEMISAMAAGWNAKLIVETWSEGGPVKTSIGLAIASRYTGGRHVCVVPDETSRLQYIEAMEKAGKLLPEVLVGGDEAAAEKIVAGLEGVDFMVVDSRQKGCENICRAARLGERGAVLMFKNAFSRDHPNFPWEGALLFGGEERIVVRSVFLPVGNGLEVVHVGAAGSVGRNKGSSRWLKQIDGKTGEEVIIRIVLQDGRHGA